jgi:thioredoxin-like negative regulator of GroEL
LGAVPAGLSEQCAGRIVVRKIDVDQFEGIWERFNFRGIPAMLVFNDGQQIHRVIGFGGKKQLRAGGAESPQLDEIRTGIKALKV